MAIKQTTRKIVFQVQESGQNTKRKTKSDGRRTPSPEGCRRRRRSRGQASTPTKMAWGGGVRGWQTFRDLQPHLPSQQQSQLLQVIFIFLSHSLPCGLNYNHFYLLDSFVNSANRRSDKVSAGHISSFFLIALGMGPSLSVENKSSFTAIFISHAPVSIYSCLRCPEISSTPCTTDG